MKLTSSFFQEENMNKRFLISVLFLALSTTALFAQTGKIAGKITDRETGEPLIGANVIIEGTERGAATNINGEFVILNVPIGKVSLIASYIGYQTITIRDILVRSNETTTKDFQLPSDVFKVDEVEILAQKPLVDRNVTNSKATVTADDIVNLPVRGITGIISQLAGIVNQGGTIYVRGSRGDATGYIVDGVPVNNPLTGGRALSVISNAIAEVSFQAGGYSAEFGGANAGLISTTTRSGGRKLQVGFEVYTDNWHSPNGISRSGDKWSVEDNSALGTNSFGLSNYTLTVGGPLYGPVKFFVAGEHSFQRTPIRFWEPYNLTEKYSKALRQTAAHNLLSPEEQAKEGLFDPQQGSTAKKVDITYPGGYIVNNASSGSLFNGNLTIDLNPINIRVGGSYAYSYSRGGASVTTILAEQRAGVSESENMAANLKLTHLLSGNTFYEIYLNYFGNYGVSYDPDHKHNIFAYGDSIANAQYGYTYRANDNPPLPTTLFGSNFYTYGYPLAGYGKTRFSSIGGKINFVHQIGRTHEIKVGGDATRYDIRSYGVDAATLWRFLRTNPDATPFQVAVGARSSFYGYDAFGSPLDDGPDGPKNPVFASFYALDKIELEDLVLNIGLRWDYINTDSREFKDPTNIKFTQDGLIDQTDNNMQDVPASSTVSPRLGFSFPVTDQTVFYAQYGKFVQQSRLRDIYLGSSVISSNIRGGLAIQTPVGFGLRPERTTQYDFGFRQQIGDFFAFDIGAFYKDIRDQIQQRNIPSAQGAAHQAYYAWVNGDFATTSGVSIKLNLRRVERIQASVDYTYANAQGTGSGPSTAFRMLWQSPTATPFLPRFTQPLDFDQTHRGSVNVDYRFGRDDGPMLGGVSILERTGLNLLFTFNSGHPYTRVDDNSYGNRRQPVEALNASRTPWNFQLDGRFDKTVSIANLDVNFYIWVINVLNTKNVEDVFMQSGSATDDGFLATDEGAKTVQVYSAYDPVFGDLYRDYYKQLNIQNANFYGTPRQIRVGMRVDF